MTRAVRILRTVICEVCNVDPLIVTRRGAATIHTLRDTFATRLVQSGMTLHAISKLLGHSGVTMTKKYAHLEVDKLVDDATKILDEVA